MFQKIKDALPWGRLARFLLFVGLLGPGIALLAAPVFFSAAGALHVIALLFPPIAFGLALVVAAALTLHPRTDEYGYLLGGILYLILFACALVAFVTGPVHSVLIFALPLVPLSYAEATRTAVQRNHGGA